MKLNKFVKDFRLSKNLTQTEFAKLCDLDQARISLIESGNLDIGYSVIERLAKATNKSVEEIRKMIK